MTEVVMDKGYHDNGWLAEVSARGIRTYIPERRQKSRRWTDKPAEYEVVFRANRRRVRGSRGRQLNCWRSERCERTFAHVCETGGGPAELAARADEREQGAYAQMCGV